MGFFSSRKAEPTPLPASERASVKVIRSRFYGKSKSLGRASPAPSASPPTLSATLPLPARIPESHTSNQSSSSTGRQVSADALTMSLAQRLNELHIANADGLLDDEEYRLLRQNLFERFSTGSDSPTDRSTVHSSNGTTTRDPYQHSNRTPSINSQRSISTAVSSLFRRATGRAAPSPTASTSGSIFSLQQQMSPTADSASVMSGRSRPSVSSRPSRSAAFSNSLSRRPSDESLMSSSQADSSGSLTNDLRGMMSRRNIVGGSSTNYAPSVSSRVTTRSTKPPSSFHLRHPALRQSLARTHEDDDDEDHPKSTAELREEIESVESEGRKLLDAFNGLELSALTKSRSGASGGPLSAPPDVNQRRLSIYPESASSSALGSAYTLIPDRAGSVRVKPGQAGHVPLVKQPVNLKRKPSVVNSIAGSFKTSASDLRGNFLAASPSLHSTRSSPNLHMSSAAAAVPAMPVSNSVPGTATKKRPPILRPKIGPLPNGTPHTAPVVRSAPLSHRNIGADPTLHALETELADIRRRKADVSARYARRLEFLRAKLKAAEIRERLTKK